MAKTVYVGEEIGALLEVFVSTWEADLLPKTHKNQQLYYKIMSHRSENNDGTVGYDEFIVRGDS